MTSTLVRMAISAFRTIYPEKYTDADPYKIIHVDPDAIAYTSGERSSKRRGWVVDGDWDLGGDPFMQRTRPRAIAQRVNEGMAWEVTALTDKYDPAEVAERGVKMEALYSRIRTEGYRSQRQLLETDPEAAWSGLNDTMHPLANEVAVDIGRHGELRWNMCGQHRLAFARVLDLDRIPVQVFRRHAEWQKIRDRVRRGEDIPEEFRAHPDLADLLGDG
ncbi:hypothetical protein [Halorubrum vacuolatum]|uniref:hypothetical protein n=1 Tax=Halorubrum vacuolatum TaxID=63740 RepID=UPI001179E189|nr:hypothetical protein [Halorubrum vacuolatum]